MKLIGATAHIVTGDLDDGPIIYKDIIKVSHANTWKFMRNQGQNVEKIVLARALKLLFLDKVFIFENKTIIF